MKKAKINVKNKNIFFIKNIFLFLIFFGIFFADFVYYFFKINFFNLGFIFWFLGYFLLLIYSIYSLIFIFKTSLKIKSFVSVFMIFLIFFLLLINADNSANLSGETTQEAVCFLNSLNEKDLGFWKNCFLGYPLRGYYLLGLPSYLFGRFLLNLNLGAIFHFIINLPIFVGGLFLLLSPKKIYDIIIGLLLTFLFHFYYFNYLSFLYEQSILPFVFSLSAFSFYYQFINKNEKEKIILLGLVLQYLIFSYTTGLMTVIIILFLLFRLLFNIFNKKDKAIILFIIITTILSIVFSFKFREDVRFFNFAERSFDILLKDLKSGIEHLFFQNKGTNFVSPIFHFIFIFFITTPLFGFFGKENFLLAIWIWGSIIFSIISKGYTYYEVEFRLHRTLVIVPALLFIMVSFIKNLLKLEENRKKLSFLFFVFMLFYITGYLFHVNYISKRQPSRHYALINYINNEIINKRKISISHIFFSNDFYTQYASLNDSLKYFLPKITYSFIEEGNNNLDYYISFPKNQTLYFLSQESVFYLKHQQEFLKSVKYLNNYYFNEDKVLMVYLR